MVFWCEQGFCLKYLIIEISISPQLKSQWHFLNEMWLLKIRPFLNLLFDLYMQITLRKKFLCYLFTPLANISLSNFQILFSLTILLTQSMGYIRGSVVWVFTLITWRCLVMWDVFWCLKNDSESTILCLVVSPMTADALWSSDGETSAGTVMFNFAVY